MRARDLAVLALTDPITFCNLLAKARQYRAPNVWEGSAFRSHPCGLVVGTIKLTNHWHTDHLCSVEITDGSGWDTASICREPAAHGDPHPKAIEGSSLQVWRCGKWADQQYREMLAPRLLDILTAAAEHVEQAVAREERQAAAKSAADAGRFRALEAAALAKATGGAA